ncbi:MAG: hypothetical protein LBG86_00395 [Puniceicoccales bacterium]|nr:hypothetical protein [Puniceicoccales bacterium]
MEQSSDEWIKLADYGNYHHRLGMQVVSHDACVAMAEQFSSLYQRLARRFHGIPIYIGHPDDPTFRGQAGHTDTRAYGWVKFLVAEDDGLWIYPKWSNAGRELIKNAHFKFLSPRWEMYPVGENRFSPRQLISIGLTNYPNMNVEAIPNEEHGESFSPQMATHTANLTIANDAILNFSTLSRKSLTQCISSKDNQMFQWEENRQKLLLLVRRRMEDFGESFCAAWSQVKRTNPFLFRKSNILKKAE